MDRDILSIHKNVVYIKNVFNGRLQALRNFEIK